MSADAVFDALRERGFDVTFPAGSSFATRVICGVRVFVKRFANGVWRVDTGFDKVAPTFFTFDAAVSALEDRTEIPALRVELRELRDVVAARLV